METKVLKGVTYQMYFIGIRFKMDQKCRKHANALRCLMKLDLTTEMRRTHSMGRRYTGMPTRRGHVYTHIYITFLRDTKCSKGATQFILDAS